MILNQKSERIYSELCDLQNNKSMQRDLIRNLRNNGKDFFFLNCLFMEFNYLHLTPIEGLPKIWKVESSLRRNINEIFMAGFISVPEKKIAEDIASAIITTLRNNRLFLFLYSLTHKKS